VHHYGLAVVDTVQGRARSHCRFVPPLNHFIPESITYSVPLFLKRHCDRTVGGRLRDARAVCAVAAADCAAGVRAFGPPESWDKASSVCSSAGSELEDEPSFFHKSWSVSDWSGSHGVKQGLTPFLTPCVKYMSKTI
jgi:hypothetical protein